MNAKIISSVLTGLLCAAAFVPGAQAGFQWTAPANVPTANAPMGTAMPHVPAAPVAPVISEGLPGDMSAVQSGIIATTPDGPASAAPIYGAGMTDDPVTWNTPRSAPRGPSSVLPAETVPLMAAPAAPVMAAPVQTQTLYNPPVSTNAVVATPMMAQQPAMITSTTTTTPAPVGYGVYETAEGFGRDLPLVMAIRQIVPPSYGFVFDEGVNLATNVSWQGGRPWNAVLQDTLTPLGLRAAINGNVVSIVPAAATMQQISVTGPAVTTDVIQAYAASPAMAPVMAVPTPITAAPAIIEGPGATFVPARADLNAVTTWTAPRNSTLRGILEDWSDRVGVELYWASEYDYPIQSAVNIQGSFEDAVQTLLKGLTESKPRPLGRLHPNLPNGPAVLVIETRQNSM